MNDACLTACFGWIMPFASLEFPTHLKSQTWANKHVNSYKIMSKLYLKKQSHKITSGSYWILVSTPGGHGLLPPTSSWSSHAAGVTLEDSDSPGRSSAAAWRRPIHLSNVVKIFFFYVLCMFYDVLCMCYDVLWCFMMFYDVLWCFMYVLWCFMMFYDVLWCFMMFYDVLCMFYVCFMYVSCMYVYVVLSLYMFYLF